MHLERPAELGALPVVATEIRRRCGTAVERAAAGPFDVELRLRTPDHPLDEDAFPLVDCVFALLHERLGVSQLDGSERRFWRTFRGSA